jgi:hypothetical protein
MSLRDRLRGLGEALEQNGEPIFAESVNRVLSGTDGNLDAFVTSNDLWGGAGSIADQAGLASQQGRREIESALIQLGEEQIRVGKTNPRTSMWVEAFKQWTRRAF